MDIIEFRPPTHMRVADGPMDLEFTSYSTQHFCKLYKHKCKETPSKRNYGLKLPKIWWRTHCQAFCVGSPKTKKRRIWPRTSAASWLLLPNHRVDFSSFEGMEIVSKNLPSWIMMFHPSSQLQSCFIHGSCIQSNYDVSDFRRSCQSLP